MSSELHQSRFIPLHMVRPHFYFKNYRPNTSMSACFFQSRQYHYLTLPLMRRVLMSPLRFVLAHLFILQVEAAATSALQRRTHLLVLLLCCSVYWDTDINYVIVQTGFLQENLCDCNKTEPNYTIFGVHLQNGSQQQQRILFGTFSFCQMV